MLTTDASGDDACPHPAPGWLGLRSLVNRRSISRKGNWFSGVLGARAAWRAVAVGHRSAPPGADGAEPTTTGGAESDLADASPSHSTADGLRNRSWASLMRRAFGFEVLACPRCGGRLRLIALIEQPAVIGRILRHLGEPTGVPPPWPARAPPDTVSFVG